MDAPDQLPIPDPAPGADREGPPAEGFPGSRLIARLGLVLFAPALAWIAALIHRGHPLAVDEIEFFRATKWVGEGLVPFRDFWEHHLPLQWLFFGPMASLFATGPGTEAILVMRWAQLTLWAAMVLLLARMAWRSGINPSGALLLLLVSPTFVRKAIEYRLDVPGNLAFLAAIALVGFGAGAMRWIGFGALMSAAVLTNMRLAPMAIAAAILSCFWHPEERRWGWNPRALWMVCGVVPVAALFLGWILATGSWSAFLDGVFTYNTTSARLLEVHTFLDALLVPVWTLDVAGIAFWIAGIAGAVMAFQALRTAGLLQFLAVLLVVSIGTIACMEVQYDYHFQNAWLLMVPLAAFALSQLRRPAWRLLVPLGAAGALVIGLIQGIPSFGERMAYQDAVMTAADRLTLLDERVLDGAGYALRRKPAYRYWFLTTGVRMMAARKLIEPYDLARIASEPPAAIIYDYRLALYLRDFPEVADFATRHYVPVYRNLWVPGMTAVLSPGATRATWIAPRAGAYMMYTGTALTSHPWFTRPLEYASLEGPLATRYAIPLDRLPRTPFNTFLWFVDDVPQVRGKQRLVVRKGSRVRVVSTVKEPTGVLLVPEDVGTICLATDEERVF